MILAGIDEAGLGPTLGPLVTASAALRVPVGWTPDEPWARLADIVSDKIKRGDARLAVADSKLVYSAGGVEALEAAIGPFSLLANGAAKPRLSFPADDAEDDVHPCYSRDVEPFPVGLDMECVEETARRLADSLARAEASVQHLEAQVLYEPILNRRFEAGMNKNQALLKETGRHVARLVEKFPAQPMTIMVDKQGGRNDYLPFLTTLFPGAWVDVLTVGPAESGYRLRRSGGDVVIRFAVKADLHSFPTALASMTAKYVRERAMAELNEWFAVRVPDLEPTAGYPVDAQRWLAKTAGHSLKTSLVTRLR